MEYPPAPAELAHHSAHHTHAHPQPTPSKRRQIAQRAVAFAMTALVGMNDSATGANLTSMQQTYNVSSDTISLVFLANVAGYFVSSISSSFITHHAGIQWSLIIAATALCLGCLVLSFAPPFGVFIIALAVLGFGSGMYDTVITTLMAHEGENSTLMSQMYAMFGVGATISPLVIGTLVDHDIHWKRYYYVPLGLSILLSVAGLYVFTGYEPPADEHDAAPESGRARLSATQRMRRALRLRVVWVALWLAAVAFAMTDILSGWVISYMTEKRGAQEGLSRCMLSGVWAGIGLGRVLLAWLLEKRLSERSFVTLLLALMSGALAVLWAVRNVPVDAVAIAAGGFFLGPTAPKALAAVADRVPVSLKSSVVSLTVGLGLIGSALGPLLFGFAVDAGFLGALPMTLIVLAFGSVLGWFVMPKSQSSRRDD